MITRRQSQSIVTVAGILVIVAGCGPSDDVADPSGEAGAEVSSDIRTGPDDAEVRRQSLLIDGEEPPAPTISLYRAAGLAEIHEIKANLFHGADPNAFADDGMAPLHTAARMGHVEVIDLLVLHGADVNIDNRSPRREWAGVRPLHWASRSGHVEAVERLLAHGADPNIVAGTETARTPLDYASITDGRERLIRLLEEYGGKRAADLE